MICSHILILVLSGINAGLGIEEFWSWIPAQQYDFSSNAPHYDTGIRKQYVCRVRESNARRQQLGFTVGYFEPGAKLKSRKQICHAAGYMDMKFIAEKDLSKIEILSFPPGSAKWVEIMHHQFDQYRTKMIPSDEKYDRFICRMPTGKNWKPNEQDVIGRVLKQSHTQCSGTNDGKRNVGSPKYEVLVASGNNLESSLGTSSAG